MMKKGIALALAVLLALLAASALAEVVADRDTVKAVQQALNDRGYPCGTPDGLAGQKTKDAIARFRAEAGMERTGVIDDALLAALGLIEASEPEEPWDLTLAGLPTGVAAQEGTLPITRAEALRLLTEAGVLAGAEGVEQPSGTVCGVMMGPDGASVQEAAGAESKVSHMTFSGDQLSRRELEGHALEEVTLSWGHIADEDKLLSVRLRLGGAQHDAIYADLQAKLSDEALFQPLPFAYTPADAPADTAWAIYRGMQPDAASFLLLDQPEANEVAILYWYGDNFFDYLTE